MAKAISYSKTGTKHEAEVNLDPAVFGLTPNHELIGLAYRAYLAAGRSASPKTLTRGLVRGGGKKPWRQKGTGRARVGSSRVPQWRGGGVTFGPTGLANYELKLPQKMRRQALKQALSLQAADHRIVILEEFSSANGKLKPAAELLAKLKLSGNLVLVLDSLSDQTDRATRNLAGLITIETGYLNVYTILNADHLIFTKASLVKLSDWLGEQSAKPVAKPKSKPEAAK